MPRKYVARANLPISEIQDYGPFYHYFAAQSLDAARAIVLNNYRTWFLEDEGLGEILFGFIGLTNLAVKRVGKRNCWHFLFNHGECADELLDE